MSDAREKMKAADEERETIHPLPVTEAGKERRREWIDDCRETARAWGMPMTEEQLERNASKINWEAEEQELPLIRERAKKRADEENRDYIEVFVDEILAAEAAGKI